MEAETLSRIITESGPLGALIVILGFLIKHWFTESKAALAKVADKIDAINNRLAANDTEIARLKDRLDALTRRVDKIETKVDGTSRPIDVR
jgi:uncharacterized coiled-coil protein SlyX